MHKVSIVGIDNAGKTSIVRALEKIEGINTIYLTTPQNYDSKVARVFGRIFNKLTNFGENYNLESLTGFAYLLHLFPYYFEEKIKKLRQFWFQTGTRYLILYVIRIFISQKFPQ